MTQDVHENVTAYAQIKRSFYTPPLKKKHTPVCHAHTPLLLLVLAGQREPLLLHTLLSPLPRGLGLRTLGVHLFLDNPLTLLLGLSLVDLLQIMLVMMLPDMNRVMMSWRENVRVQRGHAYA